MAAPKRSTPKPAGAPKAPPVNGMPPTHPGEFLTEVTLPGLWETQGMARGAFADRLGITRAALENVLSEKAPVTPSLALRLARVLGGSAQFWMNLQTAYDLKRAEAAMAEQLKGLEPVPQPKPAAA